MPILQNGAVRLVKGLKGLRRNGRRLARAFCEKLYLQHAPVLLFDTLDSSSAALWDDAIGIASSLKLFEIQSLLFHAWNTKAIPQGIWHQGSIEGLLCHAMNIWIGLRSVRIVFMRQGISNPSIEILRSKDLALTNRLKITIQRGC
jgi:hypothetical protein